MNSQLPASLARRLVLRSLLVQATWNPRTLLGTGLAWMEEGAGTEGHRDPGVQPPARAATDDESPPVVDRPFNAHPWLAPLAAGARLRMAAEGATRDERDRLADALRGPLGSLGDRLVWAGWRPALLLVLALALLLGAPPLAALVSIVIVHGGGQLLLRSWAARAGLAHGRQVGHALSHARLGPRSSVLRTAVVVLAGMAAGAGIALAAILHQQLQEGGGAPATSPPAPAPVPGTGDLLLWLGVGCVLLVVGMTRGSRLRPWVPGAVALAAVLVLALRRTFV